MGCWNGTCALTNLAIEAGDDVALYILKKGEFFDHHIEGINGFCYSDELYKSIPFVVHGKYNEYGSIEHIEDDLTLLTKYFDTEPIEKTDDYEADEDIIHNIERGHVKDYALMMIHREIHDKVIKEVSNRKSWYTDGMTIKQSLTNTFNKGIKDCKDFLKLIKDIPEDNPLKLRTNESFVAHKQIIEDLYGSDFFIKEYLFSKGSKKALKENIINSLLIKTVFSLSRKFFFPQAGVGSQDYEYTLMQMMGEFTVTKATEAKTIREDDSYYA